MRFDIHLFSHMACIISRLPTTLEMATRMPPNVKTGKGIKLGDREVPRSLGTRREISGLPLLFAPPSEVDRVQNKHAIVL